MSDSYWVLRELDTAGAGHAYIGHAEFEVVFEPTLAAVWTTAESALAARKSLELDHLWKAHRLSEGEASRWSTGTGPDAPNSR